MFTFSPSDYETLRIEKQLTIIFAIVYARKKLLTNTSMWQLGNELFSLLSRIDVTHSFFILLHSQLKERQKLHLQRLHHDAFVLL